MSKSSSFQDIGIGKNVSIENKGSSVPNFTLPLQKIVLDAFLFILMCPRSRKGLQGLLHTIRDYDSFEECYNQRWDNHIQ